MGAEAVDAVAAPARLLEDRREEDQGRRAGAGRRAELVGRPAGPEREPDRQPGQREGQDEDEDRPGRADAAKAQGAQLRRKASAKQASGR